MRVRSRHPPRFALVLLVAGAVVTADVGADVRAGAVVTADAGAAAQVGAGVTSDAGAGDGAVAAAAGVTAIIDPSALPDAATLLAATAAHPPDRRAHERTLLAMHALGADECILGHVGALDAGQPQLAAGLREMLAGLYLRERRLFRASQQLEAIPPKLRTDQAKFLLAHIALRQRRLDAAGAVLSELARRRPEDVLVARDQAQVASLRGDHAGAAAAADRLLRVRPGDEQARFVLARAHMLQGRAADAVRELEALLARNPRHGAASLNLGLVQLSRGDLPVARGSFERARTSGGRDASPYAAEAATALLMNERAAARSAAAGAVKMNPTDPLTGLLDVLAAGTGHESPIGPGSRAAAASWFVDLERVPTPASLAREIAATDGAGRIAVANVLLQLWSPGAALEWLEPDDAAADQGPLLQLTALRALVGDRQIGAARQPIARLEDSAMGRDLASPSVLAAEAAARANDRDRAIAAMRRAVARAPDQARVRMLAGDLYNAVGRPEQAVLEYRAALRLAPSDPRLQNQLAATLALVGGRAGYEEGLRLAEAGLAAQPHYLVRALLLDTRADLLYRLGRTGEALAAYRELSPTVGGISTPAPWARLGELELAAGDRSGARKAFEESLDFGREFPQRAHAVEQLRQLASRDACE